MSNSNPQTETQVISELLLSSIRTAVLRCRMDEQEISTIGVALKAGMITPAYALQWLIDIGLVDQVIAEEVRGP